MCCCCCCCCCCYKNSYYIYYMIQSSNFFNLFLTSSLLHFFCTSAVWAALCALFLALVTSLVPSSFFMLIILCTFNKHPAMEMWLNIAKERHNIAGALVEKEQVHPRQKRVHVHLRNSKLRHIYIYISQTHQYTASLNEVPGYKYTGINLSRSTTLSPPPPQGNHFYFCTLI